MDFWGVYLVFVCFSKTADFLSPFSNFFLDENLFWRLELKRLLMLLSFLSCAANFVEKQLTRAQQQRLLPAP